MRAYWFDNLPGDQRELHDSGREATLDDLARLGIKYYTCPNISDVDKIAEERNYKNRDEITISPEKMGDAYEDKVKMFFHEHLHEDEEIRYILDGSGYFDVRNKDDDWVRLHFAPNDLMIMPPGIYHRFTPDMNNVSQANLLGCSKLWKIPETRVRFPIAEGQFYEAHQQLRVITSRYLKATPPSHDSAIDLLFNGAQLLLNAGQGGSGGDLGLYLIDVYNKGAITSDAQSKGRLLTLLRCFPPGEPTKKRFVSEMMGWSAEYSDYPAGDPELHHVAGQLFAEGASTPFLTVFD
ncbi:MAG: hypothetical protein Q9159_003740 [Coniocarpon cinnabarinum]